MDLQGKLIELSDYGVSFNVSNGNFVVRIQYSGEWDVISPEDEKIGFYRDDKDSNVYYYVAPVSVDLERLFAAIDETIVYNHELEEKVVLFKEKMKELQAIFADEPIELLRTLEFKLKRKKEKPRKAKVSENAVESEEIAAPEQKVEEEKTYSVGKEETVTVSEIDAKINEVIGE